MTDFPVALSVDLTARLAAAFDVEGKIPRAIDALAMVGGTDVLLVDGDLGADGIRARQLAALGARVRVLGSDAVGSDGVGSVAPDTIVSCWSWFRENQATDLATADRILRPGGRLLVVHDYGRDDVSRLRAADLPEYTTWSRRDGWFLKNGFKIRVIHCWWTFDNLDDCGAFLGDAFADVGRDVAASLKRPRLSYNVAVYHWTKGDAAAA